MPSTPRLTIPTRKAALLGLILVVSIAGPWLVGGQGVTRTLSQIALADIGLLLVAVTARWGLLTLRLWILLSARGIRLKVREIMTALWAYDFAAESTPGGVGGAAVGLMVFRFLRVPFSIIAGVGALTLILDTLAVICVLAVVAVTTSLLADQALHWKVVVMFFLMAAGLVMTWVLTSCRYPLIRWMGQSALARRVPLKWRKSGARAWLHVARAIDEARAMDPPRLLLVLAASAGAWLCRWSVLYLALRAVNAYIPLADAMLIQFVAGLAGVLVMLPGGFLGADLTTSALLHPLVGASTIASVLILWRIFTFHANIVLGAASLIWYSFRMTDPRSLQEP